MMIYKILRPAEWAAFQRAGETLGAPVDLADGYIHFSTAGQVAETAAKHFADEAGLILLAIEASRISSALRWEPSRGGQLFAHLYGPLTLEDVVWHKPYPLGPQGHVLPAEVV